MLAKGLDIRSVIIGVSVFAIVGALWLVGLLIWSMRASARKRAVEQRLAEDPVPGIEAGHARVLTLWRDEGAATVTVSGEGRKPPLGVRLELLRVEAGYSSSLQALLALVFGMALASSLLVYLIVHNPLPAAAAGLAAAGGFWMYTQMRVAKRAALFEKQFISALDLAARSLRAGHPLLGAFNLIAEELEPPVANVFADICQQHGLGVGLEEAIQRTTAMTKSQELRLFGTSVAVQLRSGGNLAEMMERLASVIRDRSRLGRRIRVLTAQTQMSKRILLALPVILFLLLNVINPRYMDMFYSTTTGGIMLASAGLSMVLGSMMMNRMARLRY